MEAELKLVRVRVYHGPLQATLPSNYDSMKTKNALFGDGSPNAKDNKKFMVDPKINK